jgi:general secretion pathway protein H
MISTPSAPTTRRAATARIKILPAGEGGGSAGFTLLELLVVLLLLAVLASFAGSRIMVGMDGPALRAASGELAAVLRRARSEAIVHNAPVAVLVDVDAPSFGIVGERTYAVPDRLKLTLFSAVTDELPSNMGEIRFFPDGSSTGGEVTLASSNAHRYVQVDWLTGRVAVYEDSAQ